MSQVLADLVVRFGADSAELRKTLKTTTSELQKFTSDVEKMKGTLESAFTAVGIGLVANAMTDLVRGGAEAAEQMGKMAQVAGVSVETMSRLSEAARMSDLSTDQLGKALLKLSDGMAKASAGGKEQSAIFAAMGFSGAELQVMLGDTHGALLAVSDKIAGYADGAQKAALVSALFGERLARELLPFLNKGADGIRDLEGQSDRLGRTLSAEVAQGADQFNDALKRAHGGAQMLGAVIAASLAPSLDALSREFTNAGNKAEAMRDVAEPIAGVFKAVASAALYASTFVGVVSKSMADVAATAAALLRGSLREAAAADEAYKRDIMSFLQHAHDLQEAIWSPPKKAVVGQVYGPPLPPAPSVAGTEKIDAAQKALDSLTKTLQSYGQKVATFGQGDFAELKWRMQFGDLAEQFKLAGNAGEKMRKPILDGAAALEKLKVAGEASKAVAKLEEQLGKMSAELAGNGATTELDKTFERLMRGDLGEEIAKLPVAQWGPWIDGAIALGEGLDGVARNAAETKRFMEEFNATVAASEQVIAATRTPTEEYAAELERLGALYGATAIDADTYTRAVAQAQEKLAAGYAGYISPTVSAAVTGFSEMAQGMKSFGDVVQSVWQSILSTAMNAMSQMLTQWIAMKFAMAAGNAVTGGFGATGFDAAWGVPTTALAAGGPVSTGGTYLVGEEGPEIFRASSSGQIIPHHTTAALLAGARAGMQVTIVNQATGVRHDARQISANEVEIIAREVVERHAPSVVARDLHGGPNSRTQAALRKTTTIESRR